MLILYAYDKNAILVETIKTIIDADMLRTYDVLYDTLENAGQTPKCIIMDNEASTNLNRLLQKIITVAQLAPPQRHRKNSAERAICTFKNHFVAGLALVNNYFPIYLVCLIMKQAEITINLPRTSRTNLRLLAYEKIFGIFDFNATPMAPPVTRIIVHGKTT